jgi:DNA-binding CsgD family transcriptional regulator
VFSFAVIPPFYRSWLAYAVYLVIVIGLLFVLRYYRLKKFEAEKQKILEKKQQEIAERKKKFEEQQVLAQQHIDKLTKEKLEQSLVHKSRELANSTINILHKNEILQGLKSEMQKLYLEKDLKKRDTKIYSLIRLIDSEINTTKDWEVFDMNFNELHEDFINKLRHTFSNLNQNDIRLCTFLKMNKSTKEIATLMNMSIRGVETSRYRLRKKMNIPREENLYDIVQNL